MNSINDLFHELGKIYKVEWNDVKNTSFALYFSSKYGVKYKLDVSQDAVYVSKQFKLFFWTCWTDITHAHYDDIDSTIDDVFDGVKSYLNRFQ